MCLELNFFKIGFYFISSLEIGLIYSFFFIIYKKKGKDLYLDLEDSYLILTDPKDDNVLNKQPITSIRVWGVGRDNGR